MTVIWLTLTSDSKYCQKVDKFARIMNSKIAQNRPQNIIGASVAVAGRDVQI